MHPFFTTRPIFRQFGATLHVLVNTAWCTAHNFFSSLFAFSITISVHVAVQHGNKYGIIFWRGFAFIRNPAFYASGPAFYNLALGRLPDAYYTGEAKCDPVKNWLYRVRLITAIIICENRSTVARLNCSHNTPPARQVRFVTTSDARLAAHHAETDAAACVYQRLVGFERSPRGRRRLSHDFSSCTLWRSIDFQ